MTLSVSYIIKYGYSLISKKENDIVNIISIFVSTFFGFVINYICLLLGKNINIEISLIGVLITTALYIIIKIFPPKSEFFRGVQE